MLKLSNVCILQRTGVRSLPLMIGAQPLQLRLENGVVPLQTGPKHTQSSLCVNAEPINCGLI